MFFTLKYVTKYNPRLQTRPVLTIKVTRFRITKKMEKFLHSKSTISYSISTLSHRLFLSQLVRFVVQYYFHLSKLCSFKKNTEDGATKRPFLISVMIDSRSYDPLLALCNRGKGSWYRLDRMLLKIQ